MTALVERTITIKLPEALNERAREAASATALSLEQILTQSIALSLPPLEADLSPEVRSDLAALPLLNDAQLRAIARSTMETQPQAHLQALADAQKHRPLTPPEQATLNHLMEEAERVMLRKAEAYHLLARRGYSVFAAPETTTDRT